MILLGVRDNVKWRKNGKTRMTCLVFCWYTVNIYLSDQPSGSSAEGGSAVDSVM